VTKIRKLFNIIYVEYILNRCIVQRNIEQLQTLANMRFATWKNSN